MKNNISRILTFIVGACITFFLSRSAAPLSSSQAQLISVLAAVITLTSVGLIIFDKNRDLSSLPQFRSWIGLFAGGALTGLLIASYLNS